MKKQQRWIRSHQLLSVLLFLAVLTPALFISLASNATRPVRSLPSRISRITRRSGHNGIDLSISSAGTSTAPANSFRVNQPSDAGDGVCDATCTLRDAINNANALPSDSTINFAPGLTKIT